MICAQLWFLRHMKHDPMERCEPHAVPSPPRRGGEDHHAWPLSV